MSRSTKNIRHTAIPSRTPGRTALIDLDTEGERELLSDALIAESWVATFHLEDGVEQLGRRAFGARSRDLLRISSWCLRSMDSATTERVPPGLSNRRAVQLR